MSAAKPEIETLLFVHYHDKAQVDMPLPPHGGISREPHKVGMPTHQRYRPKSAPVSEAVSCVDSELAAFDQCEETSDGCTEENQQT